MLSVLHFDIYYKKYTSRPIDLNAKIENTVEVQDHSKGFLILWPHTMSLINMFNSRSAMDVHIVVQKNGY